MRPSTKIALLSRWSLIGATILMGIALLATVWSTYRGVHDASQTLMRGQADVFRDSIRVLMADQEESAADNDAALATILDEHAGDGLRYIAILGRNGRVIAAAGEPLGTATDLAAATAAGTPVEVGDRVRVVFRGPRKRRPHHGAREDRWPRWRAPRVRALPLVIEFEPSVAVALRTAARRALGVGALAAGTLLVVALALVRWFLRREALERQLEQERRLASLGQMSAVLAHEIRNPLASLKGNAQLLARALPENELPRRKADRVVDEAIRLERLSNDLLAFARTAEINRGEVDPVALVREVADTIAGGAIEIDGAGAPATWPLDRERMRQVLANLLGNAVQAGDGRARATVSLADGQLQYEVRDWGDGIAGDDLGHIFEPFYTRRTQGTGLGLAIARRLVELHGGTISAGNAADGGAVFRARIPQA